MRNDTKQALVSIYNESTSSWVDLPTPSTYDGSASTLVDSSRNSKGVVITQVIRSDIAKVELSWNYLTREQYATLCQLFEPLYGGAFYNKVKFFDTIKGDWNTKIMYCGDRKFNTANITLDSQGRPIGFKGVKISLIDTCKEVE